MEIDKTKPHELNFNWVCGVFCVIIYMTKKRPRVLITPWHGNHLQGDDYNMNISTNSKVWKDVVGYEGLYKVSECGEVLNTKRNRIMKSHRHGKGYDRIGLTFLGSQRNHYVHRLVGSAFLEPPKHIDQTQINHIDGNKNNNHYSNLEWVTPSGNMRHAVKIGLLNNPTIIKEKDKEVMAYLYIHTNLTQSEIADVFGVSAASVALAIKRYK